MPHHHALQLKGRSTTHPPLHPSPARLAPRPFAVQAQPEPVGSGMMAPNHNGAIPTLAMFPPEGVTTPMELAITPLGEMPLGEPLQPIQARATEGMIQCKGTHFWRYLNKNVPNLNATQPSDSALMIMAWLLDQNIYELQDWLAGDAEPTWENVTDLTKAGLTLQQAQQFLTQHGAPPADAGREQQLAFLSSFISQVPVRLTTEISTRTQTRTGQAASKINWKGLTPWGTGMGAELHMLPGGLPTGSGPASEPVWWKTIDQHHPDVNNTTMYVRGHLINDNIGGPGLDYNMVPLTGKPATRVGANDANAEHLRAIETKAKNTWAEVSKGKLREAFYEVIPEYNRTARAETAFVRQQAVQLRQILDGAVQTIQTRLSQLSPQQLQQEFQTLQGQAPLTLPPGMAPPTPQEQQQMLAINETKTFEKTNLATLGKANHPLAASILTQVDAGVLQASTEGQAMTMPLAEVLHRVIGNADTWAAEERYIPTALHVRLRTIDPSGQLTTEQPPAIPVTLSTDTAKVYYRPFTNTELKLMG